MDAKKWADRALVSPMAIEYGVRTISHPEAVVKTTSGEVSIEYECDFPLSQFVKVWQRETQGTHTREHTSDPLANQVRLIESGGRKNTIITRFAQPGDYHIKVLGEIYHGHPALARNQCLLQYLIQNTGRSKPLPIGAKQSWGIDRNFTRAGFEVLEPKQPIIVTKYGTARVRVQLPTAGVLPNMFDFFYMYNDGRGHNRSLHDCVIPVRTGNIVTYVAQCPFKGEYLLQLSTKYDRPQQPNEGFTVGATFLIMCENPQPEKSTFHIDTQHSVMGPNEYFHSNGLVTSAESSTLRPKDGVARLHVKRTRANTKVHADLYKINHSKVKATKKVTTTVVGDVMTFEVGPVEAKAVYFLELFVAKQATDRYTFAGCFLVTERPEFS